MPRKHDVPGARRKSFERRMRNMPGRTRTAIIVAVALFLVTFLVHFMVQTILPARENEITDWRFVCASEAGAIEGDLSAYQQATGENRVARTFGSPYMRLQYTLPASQEGVRLVFRTAHNPLRVEIDGERVLNNGYGEENFTGSSYQSVTVAAGESRTLDIYLYAPLAFSLEAYVEPVEISASESFTRYIGFGLSSSLLLLGAGLFVLGLCLAGKSGHIRRLLLLSATVFCGGAAAMLYTYTQTTALLSSPYWFAVQLLTELLLMMLAYTTILACHNKALRNAAIWIPVAIVCALVPLFQTAWAVRVAAVVMTGAQLFIAIRANAVFADSATEEAPHMGAMRGLLIYAALVGLYNTCGLFLGLGLMSGYLFAGSIALMCTAMFVIYCRQVVYLDVKKQERVQQMHADSAWLGDVTNLISDAFQQKDERSFLIEIARSLSGVVEKNAELGGESVDVHASVGVRTGNEFVEIFNDGQVENCDYQLIYDHLDRQEQKILIGRTSADMLFQQDGHSAVIHLENILYGITAEVENVIKAAFLNLSTVYQNFSLKHDVSDIQEELFINLATVVEQKSRATRSHLVIVSALSYELCMEMGVEEERARLISLAAMTHDIGKISVPESILEKEGSLDPSELEQMKQHTQVGYNILSLQNGEFFETAAIIALEHHENFDGSGYIGLRGSQIDPAARLVRVVDAVDALLSKRSYKEAWPAEEVKRYIAEQKNILFDPAVADAFLGCADALLALRERILSEEEAS